jgi:hypothetical protein
MSEIARDDDGLGAAQLVEHLRALSRRTSAAARAYWLPLILFGIVIGGSLPFYQKLRLPSMTGFYPESAIVAQLVKTEVSGLGLYWQVAILAGVVLTAAWYRWRARRTGLRTPARGFLVTGLVVSELILLIPLLIGHSSSLAIARLLHDTHQSGPLVIIAVLLWTLAWAERSRTLAIITGCYLVVALAAGVLTNGGLTGGTTGVYLGLTEARLIGSVPGVILLAAGLATWYSTRRRPAGEEPTDTALD